MNTLKEARLKRGFTQVQLAYHSGVAPGDISKFENGLATPYPSQAVRLAKVLGLDPADLRPRPASGDSA